MQNKYALGVGDRARVEMLNIQEKKTTVTKRVYDCQELASGHWGLVRLHILNAVSLVFGKEKLII